MDSCDQLTTKPPTVLIVDDDPVIVELFSAFLLAEGYHILTAGDGAEAVSAAITHVPDLILLDLNLPKLSGHEVCRWLRTEAMTRSIPIIIITGYQDFANHEAAFEAGADELLTKPLSGAVLVTRVRELLHQERPDAGMGGG